MICAALSVLAAPASSATGASTSDATPLGHASRELREIRSEVEARELRELRSYVPQRPPPSEKEQKAHLDAALAKFGDGYRIVEKTAGDRVGSKAYWAAGGNHRLPSPPPPPPPRGTQNLLMGAPSPPPDPPSPPPWNSLGGAGGILRDGANRVAFQTGLQERAPFLSYGASALGSAVSAAPRNVAGGLMSGARSAIG